MRYLAFKTVIVIIRTSGGIPYNAHGEQITPLLIFDFCFNFYAYLRLGYPAGLKKKFS